MPHRFAMFAADEATRMREAFEAAWSIIEESGSALAEPARAEGVREALALKIVDAHSGKRPTIDRTFSRVAEPSGSRRTS